MTSLSQDMFEPKDDALQSEEHDSLDSYFECITACSWVGGEDVECVSRCVEVHLKQEPVEA